LPTPPPHHTLKVMRLSSSSCHGCRTALAVAALTFLTIAGAVAGGKPAPGSGTMPDVVYDPFARGTGVIPDTSSNGARHPMHETERRRGTSESAAPAGPRPGTPIEQGGFSMFKQPPPYRGAIGR
jgi:hypothetical protein